ncbi:MAG: CPBP family intramembrane metalloprotease [Cytophagales bacterium]|nr:CPBP family intramembrane metalloprotease [Armatimonadota bacterium]
MTASPAVKDSKARRFFRLPPIRLLIAISATIILAIAFLLPFSWLLTEQIGLLVFGGAAYGPTLMLLLVQGASTAVASVLVAWFVGRVMERRGSLQEFGSSVSSALRQTAAGFAIGGAIMSLIVAVLALLGWYRFSPLPSPPLALFAAFFGFFLAALFEEVLFRGLLFRILEEGIGSWGAILLSSVVFGGVHAANPNATFLSSTAIALEAGILLASAYLLTRNLWFAVGLHWGWNLFQGIVYGAPVSGLKPLPSILRSESVGPALWTGGAFGPEAGLMALGIATAIGLLLLSLAARKGQLRTPQWWQDRRTRQTLSNTTT